MLHFWAFFCVKMHNFCVNAIPGKAHSKAKKTQIKILTYPGLAYSGFKQPGPGALLLGLAKSIY